MIQRNSNIMMSTTKLVLAVVLVTIAQEVNSQGKMTLHLFRQLFVA